MPARFYDLPRGPVSVVLSFLTLPEMARSCGVSRQAYGTVTRLLGKMTCASAWGVRELHFLGRHCDNLHVLRVAGAAYHDVTLRAVDAIIARNARTLRLLQVAPLDPTDPEGRLGAAVAEEEAEDEVEEGAAEAGAEEPRRARLSVASRLPALFKCPELETLEWGELRLSLLETQGLARFCPRLQAVAVGTADVDTLVQRLPRLDSIALSAAPTPDGSLPVLLTMGGLRHVDIFTEDALTSLQVLQGLNGRADLQVLKVRPQGRVSVATLNLATQQAGLASPYYTLSFPSLLEFEGLWTGRQWQLCAPELRSLSTAVYAAGFDLLVTAFPAMESLTVRTRRRDGLVTECAPGFRWPEDVRALVTGRGHGHWRGLTALSCTGQSVRRILEAVPIFAGSLRRLEVLWTVGGNGAAHGDDTEAAVALLATLPLLEALVLSFALRGGGEEAEAMEVAAEEAGAAEGHEEQRRVEVQVDAMEQGQQQQQQRLEHRALQQLTLENTRIRAADGGVVTFLPSLVLPRLRRLSLLRVEGSNSFRGDIDVTPFLSGLPCLEVLRLEHSEQLVLRPAPTAPSSSSSSFSSSCLLPQLRYASIVQCPGISRKQLLQFTGATVAKRQQQEEAVITPRLPKPRPVIVVENAPVATAAEMRCFVAECAILTLGLAAPFVLLLVVLLGGWRVS